LVINSISLKERNQLENKIQSICQGRELRLKTPDITLQYGPKMFNGFNCIQMECKWSANLGLHILIQMHILKCKSRFALQNKWSANLGLHIHSNAHSQMQIKICTPEHTPEHSLQNTQMNVHGALPQILRYLYNVSARP